MEKYSIIISDKVGATIEQLEKIGVEEVSLGGDENTNGGSWFIGLIPSHSVREHLEQLSFRVTYIQTVKLNQSAL